MLAGDLQHDGQAQARTIHAGTQGTVKGPENQFPFGLRNAGAGILHLQHHSPAKGIHQQPGGDHPGRVVRRRCVVDRVVDQVEHHLPQQRGVAPYDGTGRAGVRALVTHIQKFHQGARGAVMHHVHCNLGQVTGFVLQYHATALRAGQRQQLVDCVRGPDAGAANLAQREFQVLGAGTFALRQIGLHAQARQRGFELVRGFGQEALLRGDGIGQAQ